MRRIKSVDAFRGYCIFAMIVWHTSYWWASPLHSWALILLRLTTEVIGAAGFLFVSGISSVLSIRRRMEKVKSDPNYSKQNFIREYYYRSFFFFLLAVIYNAITVIYIAGLLALWSWYILFIIGFCLLIAYPLIKLPKVVRLILAIFILIISYPVFDLLESLRYTNLFWELLYHFIFFPAHEYPILPFFTNFCLGTIVGDIFYEIYSIEEGDLRKTQIKKKIVRNFALFGTIIIIASILSNIFIFHHDITTWRTTETMGTILGVDRSVLTLMLWVIGWDLVLFSLLTYFHEFKFTPEWRHRFLFYFSYYSLTLYFLHDITAPIFWNRLDIYSIWIPVTITVMVFWYISKIMYEKLGPKLSLKWHISRFAVYLSKDKS